MSQFQCLETQKLVRYVDRTSRKKNDHYAGYLEDLFKDILTEFIEFIPSRDIIILLDDPRLKLKNKGEQTLTCVSAMGEEALNYTGKSTRSKNQVLVNSYHLGKSQFIQMDKDFIQIDRKSFPYRYKNLLVVPIQVKTAIIGTVILAEKRDPLGFTMRDLRLSKVFAAYLSTSLQNVVDAKKSYELSKIDDLTGLRNDRFFHQKLSEEIHTAMAQKTDLCLIFLDLDHFKSINDQYGHLVGSQTLKEIGLILRENIPHPNATIARYGGDEYVIILPQIDLAEAVDIAETIRKAIFDKFFMISLDDHDGSMVNFKSIISASIGVASFQDHLPQPASIAGNLKNEFIKLADAGMYAAKDLGKNRVEVARPFEA